MFSNHQRLTKFLHNLLICHLALALLLFICSFATICVRNGSRCRNGIDDRTSVYLSRQQRHQQYGVYSRTSMKLKKLSMPIWHDKYDKKSSLTDIVCCGRGATTGGGASSSSSSGSLTGDCSEPFFAGGESLSEIKRRNIDISGWIQIQLELWYVYVLIYL